MALLLGGAIAFDQEWNFEQVTAYFQRFREQDYALLWIFGSFALSAPLFFPLTLLLLACAALFPPSQALFYFMGGALLSALIGYGMGWTLHSLSWVSKFYEKSEGMREHLKSYGVLGVAVIRLVPLAPYTVVNLFAGAMRLPASHFFLGTFLGLLPSALAAVFLKSTLAQVLEDPSWRNVVWPTLVIFGYVLLIWFLNRRYGSRFKEKT